MNQLQMLKRALIAYVNSAKAVWSAMAHPLSIAAKLKRNVKDYKIYGADGGVGDIVNENDNIEKYHLPIVVRGKNILDMSKHPARQGYYTDTGGGLSTSSTTLTAITPVSVLPSTVYTVTSNLAFRSVWFSTSASLGGAGVISRTVNRKFTTPENCKYILISLNGAFASFEWVMLEMGEGDGVYEPYIEPQTVDIYLDAPIGTGEVIQKSVDKLPSLPQYKGITIYEVQTQVPPSGMEVCYYE